MTALATKARRKTGVKAKENISLAARHCVAWLA